MRGQLALLVVAVSILAPVLLSQLGYGIGYVNKLFPPHPVVLGLNPNTTWTHAMQAGVAIMREEFLAKRTQTLRPRSSFVSKEYPGAVPNAKDTEGWSTIYLRVGTIDTCLMKHFPKTKAILEGLPLRVHTAFFSELLPSREELAPHCGQLRGLFRAVTVLDGEKPEGFPAIATMGAYHDHDLCLSRFGRECPGNLTQESDGKVELVHYNVGDVILFNDFVCHWVVNHAVSPRLAIIINVDRDDLSPFSNWATAWGSWLFTQRKLAVFLEGSQQICDELDLAG